MNLEEQIDAYLNGRLSDADRLAFEAKVQADPELATEIALQEEAMQLLKVGQQRAYKSQLQNIATQSKLGTQPVVKEMAVVALWQRNWFRVAAAILILIGLGFVFWPRTQTMSYPQMAEAYFETYPDRVQVRGSDSVSLIQQAMIDYSAGNYREAVENLSMISPQDTNYPMARFYQANAYLALGESGKAIDILVDLRTQNENPLMEATEWYLALAYLQKEQGKEAKLVLQQISNNPANAYQARATEILSQM